SEDGKVAIVFNGEVFNFQELKRELEAKGRRFKTKTDTEVVLQLYCELGPERALAKLNGFYAFAIHDRRVNKLLIARDRLGVKPLYYAETAAGLGFGSELKPLLAEGSLAREGDESALLDWLCPRYAPARKSIWRGAKKLPAGCYLVFDGRRLDVRRYWDLPEFATNRDDPERLAEQIWELLLDSVRLRLISDVPLGAFLSGGLDSSLVV